MLFTEDFEVAFFLKKKNKNMIGLVLLRESIQSKEKKHNMVKQLPHWAGFLLILREDSQKRVKQTKEHN